MAPRNLKVPLWTLVQHEAFGWKRDPLFEEAVAIFGVATVAARDKVMAAGGLLFRDYAEASDAEQDINYPDGHDGSMIPKATGSFSGTSIGELLIYVPTAEERERYIASFSEAVGATS